jgi:hypothetical protein
LARRRCADGIPPREIPVDGGLLFRKISKRELDSEIKAGYYFYHIRSLLVNEMSARCRPCDEK